MDLENYKPMDITGSKFNLYQYGLSRSHRIRSITKDIIINYLISTMDGHDGSPLIF